MRAIQQPTTQPESQSTKPTSGPVQRRESLRAVDFDTAVQRLAPVQAKEDTGAVHAAAQRGTSGGGGSLPYLGQIQKSFGGHDVSGIKSHTGGTASEACESMGAEAYASGQNVAFKGQPDLHTAAHEAAHIVQQRAGVQLSGGVGQAGDSYEKNADEVADRVVQGKSAEDLLGGGYGGAGAVQRSLQMKGAEEPSQKKDPYPVLGHTIQRKETRHVQRLVAAVQRSEEAGDDSSDVAPPAAEPEATALAPAELEAPEQDTEAVPEDELTDDEDTGSAEEETDESDTQDVRATEESPEADVNIQPLLDQIVQMKAHQGPVKPPTRKPAPKKPAPKKNAAKKPGAKKAAPKKNAAKKPAAKKNAADSKGGAGAAEKAKTAASMANVIKKFATQGAIEKDFALPMITGPFPYIPGTQIGTGWGAHIKLVLDQKRLFALAKDMVAGKVAPKFDGIAALSYIKSINLGGRLRLRIGPIGLFDDYGVEGSIGFQTVAQIDGRQGKRFNVSGVLQGTLNAKADVGLLQAFVGEHLEKEWLLDLARGKFILDLGRLSNSRVLSIEVRSQGNHWRKLGSSNVRSALARRDEVRRRMKQNSKATEGMPLKDKIARNLANVRR